MARVQYLVNVGGGGGQGGGAIISHRHILTASFVLTTNFQVLNVWIGGVTRTTQRAVFVQQRIMHPNYVQSPRANDIGIIVLTVDVPFDRFVQPIALPTLPTTAPYLNEQGTVLGFGGFPGATNQENLAAAFMRVVAPARCGTRFSTHVVAEQFCAEDTRLRSDFCSDDTGGPLVTIIRGVDVLTGIASVFHCLDAASQPSLFTRVAAYRPWILAQTGV